jgi:beta-xylosidase
LLADRICAFSGTAILGKITHAMVHGITYQNPVWFDYFADPFVLRVGKDYFAYGTGPKSENGLEIPTLRSSDLVHWESLGGSLQPLTDPPANNYWAPEVAEKNGVFYMYYSASTSNSDQDQRLRVAISQNPAGPFADSGKLLLPELGFSIDAHPFVDPKDGQGYLFFASDFEGDEPTGTGLSVVPLAPSLTEVAGEIRVVLRASAEWQIYERNRNYKGRVWPVWNCVEGPFVVFHEGRYYCFYSGGAWYGTQYGVEVAVADQPLGPWRNENAPRGPTVLKGIAGHVIGPGHNSVVKGPDGKTDFMVYHAWDAGHTKRQMFIDPILWTPEGPRVDGPSTERRTIP